VRLRLPADRRWRIALAIATFVIALNVLVYAASRLAPEPEGRPSSSYATIPAGLRAWTELLERNGHPVRRLRERPRDRLPATDTTLVVVDPRGLRAGDAAALARFVRRGGRLVAAGRRLEPLLGALGRPVAGHRTQGARSAGPLAPVPEVAGVRRVTTSGGGAWGRPAAGLPALGDADAPLLVVAAHGRGRAALLADASPLQNRLLARDDNAVLALGLAGGRERPVAFVESVHGFAPESGLAALPGRWQLALAGLLLAALLFVLARARRFGPPEDAARPLPPPRRAYVDALARALERTRDPVGAAAPVRAAARRAVAARAGLGPDPEPATVLAAAERLGLPPDEVAALDEPPTGQDAVLAAGRALARLERETV
jgi:hypothetical protein